MNKKKLLVSLGVSLRNFRLEKGISQEELSSLSNVDRSYLGGVERGERNVAILNLEKICNALDIKVYELFKQMDK